LKQAKAVGAKIEAERLYDQLTKKRQRSQELIGAYQREKAEYQRVGRKSAEEVEP
jgi:hypothetical protein